MFADGEPTISNDRCMKGFNMINFVVFTTFKSRQPGPTQERVRVTRIVQVGKADTDRDSLYTAIQKLHNMNNQILFVFWLLCCRPLSDPACNNRVHGLFRVC